MIVVDTNVISEPLRPRPAAEVVAWLDAQSIATLFLTATTIAELRYGVASLPAGRRRTTLRRRLEEDVLPLFADRVLPFDLAAAVVCGDLRAEARAAGRPLGLADATIAATARVHGYLVATRDTAPFETAGVPVIDPFGAG